MTGNVVFVIEDRDVRAFPSLTSAEDYLEPWWVEERRGRIFDATGKEYLASLANGVVMLKPGQQAAQALRDLLVEFLQASNASANLDDLDLATLVERAVNLR